MVDRGAHIDLFFRNGLKEFEVLPPSDVWENIKPAIRRKKRSFLLLRVAAVSAITVSLGAMTILITRSFSDKFNGPAISFNQDALPGGSYIAKAVPIQAAIPEQLSDLSVVSVPDASIPIASVSIATSAGEVYYKLPGIRQFIVPIRESSLRRNIINDPVINDKLTVINSSSGIGISNMLEDPVIVNSVNTENKWSIGAQATPTYYSSFNTGKNSVAKELNKYDKGAVAYSGGVAFNYKVNKRLSVQTGLYYSSYGQKVTGVSSFAGFRNFHDTKSGSDFAIQTSSGTITSSNSDIFLIENNPGDRVTTRYTIDVFSPYKSNLQYIDNTVFQNFNYLEIPFLVKYKVLDRKVDFNLVGGISYNLLVSNSAYSFSGGEKYIIGKTEGLSPVTFSSSLGMGMEYNLTGKISLNIEPTFRYYITPVSGLVGSSIHPYSFGILSGFSYKF
jgi:Outer membrane protein beta-barrel domain